MSKVRHQASTREASFLKSPRCLRRPRLQELKNAYGDWIRRYAAFRLWHCYWLSHTP